MTQSSCASTPAFSYKIISLDGNKGVIEQHRQSSGSDVSVSILQLPLSMIDVVDVDAWWESIVHRA